MKVVFVVGATASGKSDLALKLAEDSGGAIINCDSVQLYRKLMIGAASPTPEDRSRAPHFLYNQVAPPAEVTAGEYTRLFFETLDQIKDKFPVVFVVGGTGFYFQAIEKGMYPVGAADALLKQQVLDDLKDPAQALALYEEFKARDPEAAKKIFPKDHYRLGRAIEMMRAHGKTPSEAQAEFEAQRKPFPYPLLKLGIQISKEELVPRVEARTRKMLSLGLIKETQELLQQGFETWAPLESVGYFEVKKFLRGEMAESELPSEISTATLRLAKKQRTWFRRETDIHWCAFDEHSGAKNLVGDFLKQDNKL